MEILRSNHGNRISVRRKILSSAISAVVILEGTSAAGLSISPSRADKTSDFAFTPITVLDESPPRGLLGSSSESVAIFIAPTNSTSSASLPLPRFETIMSKLTSSPLTDATGASSPEPSLVIQPSPVPPESSIYPSPSSTIESSPSPSASVEATPKPLTKEQKRQLRYNAELKVIKKQMNENKWIFGKRFKSDIVDVGKYYKFYKRISEAFGRHKLPWYVVWAVHRAETTVSRGLKPNGTSKNGNKFIGAGQRDPDYWPQKLIDKISKKVVDLKKLPQRVKTDWKELAFIGWYFETHQSKSKKFNWNRDIYKPFIWYSADGPARDRNKFALKLRKIFKRRSKLKVN